MMKAIFKYSALPGGLEKVKEPGSAQNGSLYDILGGNNKKIGESRKLFKATHVKSNVTHCAETHTWCKWNNY